MIVNSSNIPTTNCAFHQKNIITHFCKYQQCLLPLCRLCLPLHRRQHGKMKAPIDLKSIDEQVWNLQTNIIHQYKRLQLIYQQILNKVNQSNLLHNNLKIVLLNQKEQVVRAIQLYYRSICQEIDRNHHRRQLWMSQIRNHYLLVREQFTTLIQNLQKEKYLRTVIMWNRLKPQEYINQIQKKIKKDFETPSSNPCDIRHIIKMMNQNLRLKVLELYGDMGFANLQKTLYTLRFGKQDGVNSSITQKMTGISITSKQSKLNNRLSISKSSQLL